MTEPLPLDMQSKLIAALAAGRRDRQSPDVFVGRDEELAWLRGILDDMAVPGGPAPPSVVEGIPGIGKTSMVVHFLDEVAQTDAVPVAVDAGDLVYPGEVAIRMAESVLRWGSKTHVKSIRRRSNVPKGFTISGTILGTGGSFGRSGGVESADRQNLFAAGHSLGSALSALGVSEEIRFIFFVDEAHRMPDGAKRIVRELQSGANGRWIAPIYAGMPWRTRTVLEDFCSNRLSEDAVRRLDVMEDVTVESSIWRTCRRMGIDTGVVHELARRLAADCRGFPRHIASAVSGVAAVEKRLRDNGTTIGARDVDECVESASVRRDRFYRTRLATAFDSLLLKEMPPMDLLAVLARAVERAPTGGVVRADEVREEYERVLAERDERSDELAFDALLSSCARVGLFEKLSGEGDEVRSFRIPTPSLVSFLLRGDGDHGGGRVEELGGLGR